MIFKKQKQAEEILKSEKEKLKNIEYWTSFLKTSAMQYKHNWDTQIAIHEAMPDSIACTEARIWKDNGCTLTDTANAIITEKDGKICRLFDISQVSGEFTKSYWIWKVNDDELNVDYSEALNDTLCSKYNLDSETLAETIYSIALDKTANFIDKNSDMYNVVSESVAYTVIQRCCPNEVELSYDSIENALKTVSIDKIGTAVTSISKILLAEIEKIVKEERTSEIDRRNLDEYNRGHIDKRNEMRVQSEQEKILSDNQNSGRENLHTERKDISLRSDSEPGIRPELNNTTATSEMPEGSGGTGEERPAILNSSPMANNDNIIGNTTYKYIPQKSYRKYNIDIAMKIAAKLEAENIKYSGKIADDTVTFTVSKPDVSKLEEIAENIKDDLNFAFESDTKKFANGELSATDKSVEFKPYIVADLKTWTDNSPERSKLERYETFDEAFKRFNELRNEPYNSEIALHKQDNFPMARLTLGVESSDDKYAFDIINVRAGQNYLCDDFTRIPDVFTNKNFTDTLTNISENITIDRIAIYEKDENGIYKDTPEDVAFNDVKSKELFTELGEEYSKLIPDNTEKSFAEQIDDVFNPEKESTEKLMPIVIEKYGLEIDFNEIEDITFEIGENTSIICFYSKENTLFRDESGVNSSLVSVEALSSAADEIEKFFDMSMSSHDIKIYITHKDNTQQLLTPEKMREDVLKNKISESDKIIENLENKLKELQPENTLELEIGFSESGEFERFKSEYLNGEPMSYALGNALLEYLDKKQNIERETEKLNVGWYHKTDFSIKAVINGEDYSYNGRYDIGDGKDGGNGSLSEHIRQYNEYVVINNPYHLTDEELEERLAILDVFVPFLEENSALNEKEQQIFDTYISENPVRTEINLENSSDNSKDIVYRIYQIKSGEEYHYARFSSFESNIEHNIQLNKDDYDLVYEGNLSDINGSSVEDKLSKIYEIFNLNHPEDFRGHSLSVSDVITLDNTNAYYVDSFGFKDFPAFFLEKTKELENDSKRTAEDIAIGDKYMYRGSEVTVASLTGVYPDDIGISKTEKLNGRAFSVTTNINKYNLHNDGKYLGNANENSENTMTADKFYENRDTQSVTWMYYNPDGNDGKGQFIETVIYKEDIENAINKANSSFNSTHAFMDTFYNCTQTITDRGTENFPATEKYYNEAEYDFAVEENYNAALSDIRNYLTDYYNSFDNVPALTQADIDILRTLEPRKSILNFTSDEIKLTEKWQQRFEADIDKKSPYYRAVNGDWREHEATSVPVLTIEDRNVDFKKVRDDIKSRVIERGSFINKDTNWSIQISRNGLEDTVKYGFKHNDNVIYNIIYDSSKLIENSVFLDSVISEKNNNNKANNTAFMHKFYSLCSFNGEPYLAKITVEEFADGQADTLKRMYNIQDIKIEPLRHIEFTDKQLARSILNGSDISISDLFKIVKTCDNDFYLNKGENHIEQISLFDMHENTSKTDIAENDNSPLANGKNYHIETDNFELGGEKSKFKANVEAIRTLKTIESENRTATHEEMEIMSKYTGWGGLQNAFDNRKDNWSNEYTELKNLLTEDEYLSAKASVLDSFYTPPFVIDSIYKALENMGFEGGKILDPATGVGNFLGKMPENISAKSKITAVEKDSISGRIAKFLYPDAKINISGFEDTVYSDNTFDVAVGNIPFGDFKLSDRNYDKHNFMIHDYFFAKSIDKVHPGGIIAFITSKGTLDKANPKVRKYISERADLIGAIRLPNNTFKSYAGTEVTSDIIFLQKREVLNDIAPDWVYTGIDKNGFSINSYFASHPEMILGETVEGNKLYGSKDTMVVPFENSDLKELLDKAVDNIKGEYKNIAVKKEKTEKAKNILPANPDIRNYSFGKIDGKIYYREDNIMTLQNLSGKRLARMKGMCDISRQVHKLLDMQLAGHTEEVLQTERNELNRIYDKFTSEHGLLNEKTNADLFSKDVSAPLLLSLEIVKDGKLEEKAAIFTRTTLRPPETITHAESSQDALIVSISEKACVDMEFMQELTGKSESELYNDLKGDIFKDPLSDNGKTRYITADEYLSGNIREKLKIAKLAAENSDEFELNVNALENSMPIPLEAGEIAVQLGSSWIDTKYIEQFIREKLDIKDRYIDVTVHHNEYTASWNIENKSMLTHSSRIKSTEEYGTSRKSAAEIIENSLNMRDTSVYDVVYNPDTEKEERILNHDETLLARQKQTALENEFKDWIFEDADRRNTLVEKYNVLYNSVRQRQYNGENLTFGGMTTDIQMKPHQKDAIAHALYGGNTLFAHKVGAGKTFEMIATAMEGKRLGLHSKSLIAVPNHMTRQFANDFFKLYPNANILVAEEKDFSKDNRRKLTAKIATGDFDAVIIGHSQLIKIPISREREEAYINKEIANVVAQIENMKAEKGDSFTIKDMERVRKNLQTKLDKLLSKPVRDNVVTFEQLGVDKLIIDEADMFKNLFISTKMSNLSGVASNENVQKTQDLFIKCQYLNEITDGKGIVFATGTPISNSISEAYVMQKYLNPKALEDSGLAHFDAWAANFAQKVTRTEFSPDGRGFRTKTRLAKFNNIPELMTMFKDFTDIKMAEDLNLPEPECERHTVAVDSTPVQKDLMQSLGERAEKIHNKMVRPEVDNMLKITIDGTKIGLDQRLINPILPDDPNSKVNTCINNVFRIYNDTQAERLTQVIFCDYSTPKADGSFSIYDDIRKKLIEKGIPEKEVAFIHDCKNNRQ
ncbi:MAG: hypothetical protein IJA12_05555, partial [Oscillospiraceae bacterium]|nr:hypothetical protein [Oscillospiraceae bacterium]